MTAETVYGRLATPAGLAAIAELESFSDERAAAAAARARSLLPPEVAAAALATAAARRRSCASGKFARPERMLFTRAGYEQASSEAVARHRAERLAQRGRVVDLCCGIGSDAIALAGAGATVSAVDIDAEAVACARHNVQAAGLGDRAAFAVQDALQVSLDGCDAAFADPSRRSSQRRARSPQEYAPPLAALLARAREIRGGALCLKVAPGLDIAGGSLRAPLGTLAFEAEWVSEDGTCKEAALWCGDLARFDGARRATVIVRRSTNILDGDPKVAPPISEPAAYVGEPDPAVIRSGLLGTLCAQAECAVMDRRVAYVTAARAMRSPFIRWYQVTESLPFGVKRVRAYLREHALGRLIVKTRAFPLTPEAVLALLKPSGDGTATLICTTLGSKKVVFVCSTPSAVRRTGEGST